MRRIPICPNHGYQMFRTGKGYLCTKCRTYYKDGDPRIRFEVLAARPNQPEQCTLPNPAPAPVELHATNGETTIGSVRAYRHWMAV